MPRVYDVAGELIQGCHCGSECNSGHSRAERGFAPAGQAPSYAPSLDLAPVHMEIHISLDFQEKRLTNRAIITFHDARPVTSATEAECRAAGLCVSPADPFSGVPSEDGVERPGRSSIKLNARNFSQVSVKTVESPVSAQQRIRELTEKNQNEAGAAPAESNLESSVAVKHDYDGSAITLEWSRPFRPNETRSVEISYVVESPVTGLIFGPKQHPTWAISDHETERAQYWLPCVDLPSVRTALDFFITAPSDKTILANGLLVDENVAGDLKTAHWRLDNAVCPSYLLCIAVGNFVEFDHGEFKDELASPDAAPIKIKYFGVPQQHGEGATSKHLGQSFRETPAMLKWLSQLLQMPFPFPKYYQFIVHGVGGAMENISLVSWDEVFLLDEKLSSEFQTYTDMVNIHEMGHSYFGDSVVCRHFDHAWLKEGWATYCEYLWLFDHRGADTALWYMTLEGEAYMNENRGSYNRPIVTNVYEHSWNMYDMHLYPGGAWRLHMLMHKLGRVAFFRGVNLYLRENKGKVVETDTFRHCLERAAGGVNLTEFFQQWVYGYGFPEIKAQRKYADGSLAVVMQQTQKFDENGTRTGQAFSITLEVYVEVEPGVWRMQNAVFDATGSASVVFTQLPHAPLQVLIDPFQKVLHRMTFDPGFDALVRTLNSTSNPPTATSATLGSSAGSPLSVPVSGIQRGRAAAVLISNYGLAGVRAVANALATEPFWGARVNMAKALASCPLREAQVALAGLILSERDNDAIQYIMQHAGSAFKSETIAQALRNRYQQSATELGYRAQRNLLAALAHHGGVQDIPTFVSAIFQPQFNGIVQAGAVNALRTTIIKALDNLLPPSYVPKAESDAAESKESDTSSDVNEYVVFSKFIALLDRLVKRPPTLSSPGSNVAPVVLEGSSVTSQIASALDQFTAYLPVIDPQPGSKAAVAIRVAAATSLGEISVALKHAVGYEPLRKKIERQLASYALDASLDDTSNALFTTCIETIANKAGSAASSGLLNSLSGRIHTQNQGWLKKQVEALNKLTATTTPSVDGEIAKLNDRIAAIEKKAAALEASEKKSEGGRESSHKSGRSRTSDVEKQLITAAICLAAAGLGFFLGRRK